MTLFGGIIPITGISFLLFCVFAILFVGYALGRITIKGVSLGDAGVFIIALVFGALFYDKLDAQLVASGVNYADKALSIIQNLGLILFVTAVGFIAGPKFFGNLKRNFKSYVLLGLVVILAGGLAAIGCIYLGRGLIGTGDLNNSEFTAMIVGIISGSLTSTPAFAAAGEAVAVKYPADQFPGVAEKMQDLISVGHGIAYIFGVIGVVLFVQLIPKIMKADMAAEREKLVIVEEKPKAKKNFVGNILALDHLGFAPFALAAVLGTFVGKISIPLSTIGLNGSFSLTTTGGCLLVALVLGHFGRIWRVKMMPEQSLLKIFRELGLVLFLVGAGIPGGAEFIEFFNPMYFVYGIIITLVPMILGFFFAKYVLKLSLLNNLGAITGGMTSTPALGTLIGTAGTEDVANAYAATYPIALIAVVLLSNLLLIIF